MTETLKIIAGYKNQLAACGISNVLINGVEENFLITSESVGRKKLFITSAMFDFSGRFLKTKLEINSSYQTNEFELKSQPLRFNYFEEFENHSKKLFKQ